MTEFIGWVVENENYCSDYSTKTKQKIIFLPNGIQYPDTVDCAFEDIPNKFLSLRNLDKVTFLDRENLKSNNTKLGKTCYHMVSSPGGN